RLESQRLLAYAPGNDLIQPDKRTTANKEDIRRVNWSKFLMRMLAPALGRNVRNRTFQNLQQCLLHAFAGDVARDRRILILPPDLIDFIDIDDAGLRSSHIAFGRLQQLQDD